MNTGNTTYLIDGSSYIYRAFYAMRNLSTSKGMPTNAVYIFTRMLVKLLEERKPERICFVMDSKGPTVRHEMYSDYKANRQRMPEELQVQVPYIVRLVEALGIPIISLERFEADDIIATLARNCSGGVVIVSGDKDLMQLVNERVTVWDTLKEKVFDRDAVADKFKVGPEYIADLLAIMGDSSDNVPGVPGIGEKGAVSLINEFGHVSEIIENAQNIKAKRQRTALEANPDMALLSLDLVRLDRDVELGGERSLCLGSRDEAALRDLFAELEFREFLKGEEEAEAFEGEITISAEPEPGEKTGLFIQSGLGAGAASGGKNFVCFESEPYLGLFSGNKLCMHDAKESMRTALMNGMDVSAAIDDTMIAAYCIDAANGGLSLEDLSSRYLGKRLQAFKDLKGSGRKARKDIPEDERAGFLAAHSNVLAPLMEELEKAMKDTGVLDIYNEIEMPLVEVLAGMEAEGVMLDPAVLGRISGEISDDIATLEEKIFGLAGSEFNINSTKQLGKVLFEDLGLPVVRKTKTGYSTDSRVLETLARDHELPAVIVEYRGLTKLKNTYVDTLPNLIDPTTGRIHSHFNQAVTATGRISSSDPNLQNIPVRSELGRRIRAAFVAPEGTTIMSADYSQIELRVLAHITGDKNLIDAFEKELDIHARTASEIFGIEQDQVTEDQRRAAKTINFGIMYGMGPHKLAGQLGIKQGVAKTYIENYLAKYKGVREYMENMAKSAAETGCVTTMMGRRRTIPEINSRNFNEREGAKRIAVNTPIQGSAADIIKIAMVNIQEKLAGMKSTMILQVHDELVFEVHPDERDDLFRIVKDEMENAVSLKVPLKVDIGFGSNWSEAH